MTASLLPFVMLSVAGADREKFLQGLLTADVLHLPVNQAALTSACDAKGRVVANFLLYKQADAIYLILSETMLETVTQHCQKYAVFSKVSLQREGWYFSGKRHESEEDVPPFALAANQAQVEVCYPGKRVLIASKHAPQRTELDAHAWQLADINEGIASITPATTQLFTPQMLNLERWGGVSFTKGCYLGQEIIARTQHLGKLKRHLRRVEFSNAAWVQSGVTVVSSDGTVYGHLINQVAVNDQHYCGLAVIEDRALEKPLLINTFPLKVMESKC